MKDEKWKMKLCVPTLFIERALNGEAAALDDMSVDHGCLRVFVVEEFLNGSDIITVLKKLRGEGMSKGVGSDGLVEAHREGGLTNGFLQYSSIKMVAFCPF